jgi:hypothetical protein
MTFWPKPILSSPDHPKEIHMPAPLRARKRHRAGVTSLALLAAAAVVAPLLAAIAATPPASASQDYGIWSDSVAPKNAADTETSRVKLGVKFKSATTGYVKGIQFYRAAANAGPHVGELYSAGGTRLAQVSFPPTTATGWVTAQFAAPVKIAAGKQYVASYVAPQGRYAGDNYALSPTRPAVNGALTATQGVYTYGAGMPTQTWRDSNYYVDVVYSGTATATPTPSPTVSPSPTTAPTTPPPTTPPPTTAPTSCTNPVWSSSHPMGTWDTEGYKVNNNMWSGDAGPQTMSACAWNSWYVVSHQPGTGTDDSVKTYPATKLPVSIPLSSLTTLRSSFDVTVPPGGGTVAPNSDQWNAAYDLWLDNYSTEVMIWNTWTMNWRYWYGVHRGEMVTIDGVTYAAYTNGAGLWFIRQSVTDRGSVDLAAVLKWAVSKGWLRSTQVVNQIEYGFEVSYTRAPTKFTLNDYALSAN